MSSGALGLSVVVFPSLLAHVLCLLISFDSLGRFLVIVGPPSGVFGIFGIAFWGLWGVLRLPFQRL